MYEGQYDDRISPLIEDAKVQHWPMIWWFLLRQYATGLVFGVLIMMDTCELQMYGLVGLWVLHIGYLSILRPMLDPLSMLFELFTLSVQLLILMLFLLDHLGIEIGVIPVIILLNITVCLNCAFHFPARHYGVAKASMFTIVKRLSKYMGREISKEIKIPKLHPLPDAQPVDAQNAESERETASLGLTDPSPRPSIDSLESSELEKSLLAARTVPRPLKKRETFPPSPGEESPPEVVAEDEPAEMVEQPTRFLLRPTRLESPEPMPPLQDVHRPFTPFSRPITADDDMPMPVVPASTVVGPESVELPARARNPAEDDDEEDLRVPTPRVMEMVGIETADQFTAACTAGPSGAFEEEDNESSRPATVLTASDIGEFVEAPEQPEEPEQQEPAAVRVSTPSGRTVSSHSTSHSSQRQFRVQGDLTPWEPADVLQPD
jgi:hypothetical protein